MVVSWQSHRSAEPAPGLSPPSPAAQRRPLGQDVALKRPPRPGAPAAAPLPPALRGLVTYASPRRVSTRPRSRLSVASPAARTPCTAFSSASRNGRGETGPAARWGRGLPPQPRCKGYDPARRTLPQGLLDNDRLVHAPRRSATAARHRSAPLSRRVVPGPRRPPAPQAGPLPAPPGRAPPPWRRFPGPQQPFSVTLRAGAGPGRAAGNNGTAPGAAAGTGARPSGSSQPPAAGSGPVRNHPGPAGPDNAAPAGRCTGRSGREGGPGVVQSQKGSCPGRNRTCSFSSSTLSRFRAGFQDPAGTSLLIINSYYNNNYAN